MLKALIERIFPSLRTKREADEYQASVDKWNRDNAHWGFTPKGATASAPNSFVFGPNESGVAK